MFLITVSGPPAAGKTAIILKAIETLRTKGKNVGVVKLDCLSTHDDVLYKKKGVEVKVGLSGNLCPDHYFVANIEACLQWGRGRNFGILISESAGLCNRCSPHIKGILSVCVIDNLMGVNAPNKIGPMLKMADVAVITKGDIVSQAEREVFAFRVRQANSRCIIINVNGITGQGAHELCSLFLENDFDESAESLTGSRLRFSMPAALCSYCLGETKIGEDFQMGNVRKMVFK